MMRAILLATAIVSSLWPPAHAAPQACPPAEEPDSSVSQPLLKPMLKPGGKLDVLVVGSAQAQAWAAPLGAGPVSKDAGAKVAGRTGYPDEMVRALKAALPGLQVTLTYDGGRFMSAPDMLGVITAGLAHHHYGLIIWQTGTADAVRDEALGDFYQALSDGAVAAASAGAALVLVEPQFSRFLEANADIGPYLSSMQEIASTSGALLFDRYAIMRDWAEADQIDLENAAPAARPAVAARLHACLGEDLARSLLAAVAAAQ